MLWYRELKMKKIVTVILVGLLFIHAFGVAVVVAQPIEKVPVLIKFNGKPESSLVRAFGGEIKFEYSLIPVIACSLPQQAIAALLRNPAITYIEEDKEVHALSDDIIPWGVDRIEADVVQSAEIYGSDVKLAIIDTGIDYTHPDLSANYIEGWDFVNNDDDPKDDHGHGTHCAGIAAAANNEKGIVGVAPAVKLYGVKVLNSRGSGSWSTIIKGIEWCVDNDIQIASMSIGGSSYSQSLEEMCDLASSSLVLVAAAGNNGDGNPDTEEISYPAAFDSVIAVGATAQDDSIASWSNSGGFLELAAPGVGIYSTLPTYRVTLSRRYGYDYGYLSGTSMACPHVAGVAALIIDSGKSVLEVRGILQGTADDKGTTGFDWSYGYGLVDADEAAGVEETPVTDETAPVISNVLCSEVTSTTATITWDTDEPSDSTVILDSKTVSDSSLVIIHSVTLTDLEPGTPYTYVVESTDASGNTATDDNGGSSYSFTTLSQGDTPKMKADIAMSQSSRKAGKNTFYWAIATVTMTDISNHPLGGATVYGIWDSSTVVIGTTNSYGQVSFSSSSLKNPSTTTTVSFDIENVELAGYAYDADNSVISGSIDIPESSEP
jgi:subtilisin